MSGWFLFYAKPEKNTIPAVGAIQCILPLPAVSVSRSNRRNDPKLSTAQSATGLKTFSALPQSSVVPTIGAQLVNKTYADSLIPSTVANLAGGII